MISKAELEHILELKTWSTDVRAKLRELQESNNTLGRILQKATNGQRMNEAMFDNVDWLIALIERELHTAGVKALVRLGDKK